MAWRGGSAPLEEVVRERGTSEWSESNERPD